MHTIITVIRAEKAHKSLTKPTREALSRSPTPSHPKGIADSLCCGSGC